MFYNFIQEKIAIFQVSEEWQSIIIVLISYFVLFLLTFIFKQILSLFNKLVVSKAIKKSKITWDDIIWDLGIFKQVILVASFIFILSLYPVFILDEFLAASFIKRLIVAFFYFTAAKTIALFLDAINEIYKQFRPELAKRKPIKGYLQMVKIFLYIVAVILIITSLIDVSPLGLLSGLGALSAVLMLVFKDPIMGFVSSLQLTGNDLVRIGDWVEIPKYGADGAVLDINLQTIRVQNWDMSITSVPVYALVSDSFKNWRGMSESAGRRVKKSIYIDMKTVRFLSEEELDCLEKLPRLKEYLQEKRSEIKAYNARLNLSSEDEITPRKLTNLGTFRAYIVEYLKEHPLVSKTLTFMVRYLDPTSKGIPVELYFFSANKNWVPYEGLQSDVLDHVLSVMHFFDLAVFQDLTGEDFKEGKKNS